MEVRQVAYPYFPVDTEHTPAVVYRRNAGRFVSQRNFIQN